MLVAVFSAKSCSGYLPNTPLLRCKKPFRFSVFFSLPAHFQPTTKQIAKFGERRRFAAVAVAVVAMSLLTHPD